MSGTRTITFIEALDAAGIGYELLEHPRTDRAADEATVLGINPKEVAKTIVVTAGETNVRVILPASERIDMHKLRDLLATGKEFHLLTEDALARGYPEFELGAVPPLGGRADEVIVDRRIGSSTRLPSRQARTTALCAWLRPISFCNAARVADVCATEQRSL
jgi:Ala-tRNA(Pro) deacylase